MNKGCMVAIAAGVVLLIVVIVCGAFFVSTMNSEVKLRNTITAKQKDNESEFDNMWKKISQVAQVTDAQKNALKEIFVQHAQARNVGGGTLMKWIHESVPNVDTSTFNNLQNIITGSRDAWTMRQKELLDLKREHDNLIDVFPGSMVCSILGRQKINVTIITSSRSQKAMQTGTDDDVDVFKKKEKDKKSGQ